MDGSFKTVNLKVNLGRPNARRPRHRYVKGQIFEKPVQKSILAAQAFGYMSDKYVTKKVRVFSLTCDMPTDPYLCPYQILSKYFKPLWSAQEFGLEIRSGDNLNKE